MTLPTLVTLPSSTMSSRLPQLAQRTTPLSKPSIRYFSFTNKSFSRLRQPGEPTGPNEPPTHTASSSSKSPLKVWPFVFIFATGGFLFKKIVDQRKGQYQSKGPIAGHSPSRP